MNLLRRNETLLALSVFLLGLILTFTAIFTRKPAYQGEILIAPGNLFVKEDYSVPSDTPVALVTKISSGFYSNAVQKSLEAVGIKGEVMNFSAAIKGNAPTQPSDQKQVVVQCLSKNSKAVIPALNALIDAIKQDRGILTNAMVKILDAEIARRRNLIAQLPVDALKKDIITARQTIQENQNVISTLKLENQKLEKAIISLSDSITSLSAHLGISDSDTNAIAQRLSGKSSARDANGQVMMTLVNSRIKLMDKKATKEKNEERLRNLTMENAQLNSLISQNETKITEALPATASNIQNEIMNLNNRKQSLGPLTVIEPPTISNAHKISRKGLALIGFALSLGAAIGAALTLRLAGGRSLWK